MMGPVFPCGCMTLPLGLPLVFWSTDLDCANTAVEAHKTKAAVRAKNLSDMPDLKGPHARSRGMGCDGQPAKQIIAIEVPIYAPVKARAPISHVMRRASYSSNA